MRTQTQTTVAPKSHAKLSPKAKRPVKTDATLTTKAAARTIGATEPPKGTIPLKKLCAEIGINPKVARRELRKHRTEAIADKTSNALRTHDLHTRWFLSGAQLTEARKILTAYVARNGESEATETAPKAAKPKAKAPAKKK